MTCNRQLTGQSSQISKEICHKFYKYKKCIYKFKKIENLEMAVSGKTHLQIYVQKKQRKILMIELPWCRAKCRKSRKMSQSPES